MKTELRKKIVKLRQEIENKKNKDEVITNNIKDLIKDFKNILIYYPIFTEINILDILETKNKNFYFPFCKNNNIEVRKIESLKNLVLDEEKIYSSPIQTQDEVEVAIVPALAMNKKMYRLGYGKGYYDRYLKNKNILKIAVVYDIFILEEDYQDEWDICFDYIVTENRVIKGK